MEKITLLVTKEMKERLSKEAATESRSVSNYINVNYLKKEPATSENTTVGGAEVDKVVSLLPQLVVDFYQEQALDSDGDLHRCLARNLIERSKVNGISTDESPTHNVKVTEVPEDYSRRIREANRRIRSMNSTNVKEISTEEISELKESLGIQ